MEVFLKLFDSIAYENGFELNIHYSSISDWGIEVGFKITNARHGERVLSVQNSDIDMAFAEAQIELKKWMLENKGGY